MSTIKANDIQNASGGIPTVKSQQLIPTAWVNFNGSGTVAIRDSEGVSSITDNGTGNYSANFATNMANSNYVAAGSTDTNSAKLTARATGSCTVVLVDQNNTAEDRSYAGVIVMGGQS